MLPLSPRGSWFARFLPLLLRYPLLIVSAIVLMSSGARASEFWLEPVRFWVPLGSVVHIRRLVGENFRGTAWGGARRRVLELWHCAPGTGARNALPAATATATATDTLSTTLTLAQPGTHLVGLATDYAFATFTARNFTRFLGQQQLQSAATQRALATDTTQPVRDAYRRCAKTLIQVGTAIQPDTSRVWGRVLLLPLELVPEQDPAALLPGAALTLRVLRRGQPAPGQLVSVWYRHKGISSLLGKRYSNQNGRVLFRLSGPGEYLAGTVQLEPAPATLPADWQSTWSTLSFGILAKKRP